MKPSARFNKVFWSAIRVSFFSSYIFVLSVAMVRYCPPVDGNYARHLGLSLLLCTSYLALFRSIIPSEWWSTGSENSTGKCGA